MKYGYYGLDESKKASDEGRKGDSHCLWCSSKVPYGFSMCFQNWVICRSCSIHATDVENIERWEIADECFKCHEKETIGLRTPEAVMPLYICKSCVDWSKQQFRNKDKTKLNNQRKEKMTTEEILSRCTIDGLNLKMPAAPLQLDTEWRPLKHRLESLGGKWIGGNTQAFVFQEDPAEVLKEFILEEEETVEPEPLKTEDEMNFFKQLSEMLGDSELSISIRKKDETITIVMLPRSNGKAPLSLKPISVSGMPEEVDAQFFTLIQEPLEKVASIVTNAAEYNKQLDDIAAKKTKSEKAEKPKKAAKEEKPKEQPKAKPVEKVEQNSLFDV